MSGGLETKIKQKGYWRVIIRPTKEFYREDRFGISEIGKIIESTQVRLRGWYYPHADSQDCKIIGKNIVSCEVDFENLIERWDFTTSGQFVHILAMEEDYMIDEEKAERVKARFHFNKDDAKDITKFFEIVWATLKITEIYLFASHLAQLEKNKDVEEFEILIELHDVKDRMLFIWDISRSLWMPYVCRFPDGVISLSGTYKKDNLIAKYDTYATEKIVEVGRYFNWPEPNVQSISEDQKKLLERRL
jgi:hypothetical protein